MLFETAKRLRMSIFLLALIAFLNGRAIGQRITNSDQLLPRVLNNRYFVDQFPGADPGAKIQKCLADLPARGWICDGSNLTPAAMTTVNIDIGLKSWALILPSGVFHCTGGPCLRKSSGNTTTRFQVYGSGMNVTKLVGDGLHEVIDFTDNNFTVLQDLTLDGNGLSDGAIVGMLSSVPNITSVSNGYINRVEFRNPGANTSGLHLRSSSGMLVYNDQFNGLTAPHRSSAIRLDNANGDNLQIDGGTTFHNWASGIDNTQSGDNGSGFHIISAIFGQNQQDILTVANPEEPIVIDYAFTEGSVNFLKNNSPTSGDGVSPSIRIGGLYVNTVTDRNGCVIDYTGRAPLTISDSSFTGPEQKICLNSSLYQNTAVVGGNYAGYEPFSVGPANTFMALNTTWNSVPHVLDVYRSNAGGAIPNFSGGTGSIGINGYLTVSSTNPKLLSVVPSPAGGGTTWAYMIVFRQAIGGGHSAASATVRTTNGSPKLDSSHFNILSWSLNPGQSSCDDFSDIYRSVTSGTPGTVGKIATISACKINYKDTGGSGDGSAPPSSNTSGYFQVGNTGTRISVRQNQRTKTGLIGPHVRAEALLTWTHPFEDTNYTVQCNVEDSATTAGVQGLTIERLLTKSATQVGAVILNPTDHVVTGILECSGDHD